MSNPQFNPMPFKRVQPTPNPGHIYFPCPDCSLTFSTHQALGGHRKIHTKLLDPDTKKMLKRQKRMLAYQKKTNADPRALNITLSIGTQQPISEADQEWSVEVNIPKRSVKLYNFIEEKPMNAGAGSENASAVADDLDLSLHL